MTYTPTKMPSSTDGTCKKRYKVKEVNLKRLEKLVKKLENGN
jgi:exonuclease VII small subunit